MCSRTSHSGSGYVILRTILALEDDTDGRSSSFLQLKKDGHRCTIVTHDEFKPWIECRSLATFANLPLLRSSAKGSSLSSQRLGSSTVRPEGTRKR